MKKLRGKNKKQPHNAGTLLLFTSLLCTIVFMNSGCLFNPSSNLSSEQPNSKKNTDTSSEQSSESNGLYSGIMKWTYTDTTSSSLCGMDLDATILVELLVNEKDGSADGTATVKYTDIDYSAERLCTDCAVAGLDGTLLLKGVLVNNTEQPLPSTAPQTITVDADLESGVLETQISEICFGDREEFTQQSQGLYFSLDQAGFFDEWSIELPTKQHPQTTKLFSLDVAGHRAEGTLTLTQ